MSHKWLYVGGHHWQWKIFIWVFILTVIQSNIVSGGVRSCPDPFVDIGTPDTEVCALLINGSISSFTTSRYLCQSYNESSDLINLDNVNTANISKLVGYSNSTEYYVGLTDADEEANYKWVIDGTTFDNTSQRVLLINENCSAACRCGVYVDGALELRDCLDHDAEFICGTVFSDDPVCPTGWVGIKDRCYLYIVDNIRITTFDEALDNCYSYGAVLARTNFYDSNFARILAEMPLPNITYLVGLKSNGTDTDWIWQDGTIPHLIAWERDPTSTEMCAALGSNITDGQLRPISCTSSNDTSSYICERVIYPTTEGMVTTAISVPGPIAMTTDVNVTGMTTGITGRITGMTTGIADVSVPEITTDVTDVNVTGEITDVLTGITTDSDISTAIPHEVTTSVDITTEDAIETVILEEDCCPEGTRGIGNNCFIILGNSSGFYDALMSCSNMWGTNMGASLARIDPLDEVKKFIIDFFNGNGSTSVGVWIGLYLNESVNDYIWTVDNTALEANDSWSTGQPTEVAGDICVAVNVTGLWSLTNCSTVMPYICQVDKSENCNATNVQSYNLNSPHGIDECLDNPCNEVTQDCVNHVDGGYSCQCKAGFEKDPVNALNCILNPCNNINCDESEGRITCVSGVCQCIDDRYELQSTNGPCSVGDQCSGVECDDIDGLITCVQGACRCVQEGYELDKPAGPCIKLRNNMCNPDRCQNGGTCILNEKYIQAECWCTTGFYGTSCEVVKDDTSNGFLIVLTVVAVIVFIIFVTCFCCLFVFFCGKSQAKNKMLYQYESPSVISQQIAANQGRSSSTFNNEDFEISMKFPIIVRNRRAYHDMAMNETSGTENPDEDSVLNEHRLHHFEKALYATSDLNSHMLSRGSAASISSGIIPSVKSNTAPSCSGTTLTTFDENHGFNTPYTTDGTSTV